MKDIVIMDYLPAHQPHFERFNKHWIEKYFWLEPVDEWVLTNPEEAIIEPGGAILVAAWQGEIAGVVALRKVDNNTYEFTKMAVDEPFRRRGIAEALALAAIEKAKALNSDKIILYSQTTLKAAIELYRKLGFIEVPLIPGQMYKRSDIKMELSLKEDIRATR